MNVNEAARLTGVSVRTLHHYDKIGLLKPDRAAGTNYRFYSDENLADLQQILFFRELGFSLKHIKQLMNSPGFERVEALEVQRSMLFEEKNKLEAMLETIERTIESEKGRSVMTNKEKFEGFDFQKNRYEEEAKERWGAKAVEQANSHFDAGLQKGMNEIYYKLAGLRHMKADAAEVQDAIEEWFVLLNRIGDYSLAAFAGLGEMYTADERFTKSIDQFGEGLASFMCDAMNSYANNRK